MKYRSTIVGYGADAFAFLDDPELNFLIIFNENAMPELDEISVIHTKEEINGTLEVGDTLKLCGTNYRICAIDEEAQETMSMLGHATLCFKGEDIPDRPGCIMLKGEPLTASDIVIGGTIEIY